MTARAPEWIVDEPTGGEPVLLRHGSNYELTDHLLAPLWTRWPWFPWALGVTGFGTFVLVCAVTYTVVTGIGLWGNNIPVAWAFAIVNFVWWIGIGHAGTFISAILLLFEVPWRTSINRFAEAMTLFAVVQAGLFPVLHLGRPWFAYWLVPYPSEMGVWPQFRSSLPWDVVAVTTYFTVSLLFWYAGLLPDLAAARDRAPTLLRRRIYGVFALGWRGATAHWRHYRITYLVLAGLATPLVLSVHTCVSFDFSIAQLPGWHSTIFPPYFVAGAIFSGFAMVLQLLIPVRAIFGLGDIVTKNHLDNMAKMLLVTGWVVAYAYLVEPFIAWYGGNRYEKYMLLVDRPFGAYGFVFWGVVFCNVVVVQTLWFRRMRTSAVGLFVVACLIQLGMWSERFMLIVGSLHRDFLPSSWRIYVPSWIDWTILGGTCCFFLFLFLLFLRFVPFIPISEMKEMRHELERPRAHANGARSEATHRPVDVRAGVIAEFESPEALVLARDRLRREGYTRLESWTPHPVRSLVDRLPDSAVPWVMLFAGLLGGALGYLVQWWCNARSFPINVGGRPLNSAPAFIPITFESAVLAASVTGFLTMLGLCGLPRLSHPTFGVDGFERASVDRFWIGVDESDPRYDERLPALLSGLGAIRCERLGGGT